MSSPGQPADTPPDPSDAAGNWLADRYQLTSRDRERVKTATLRGQPIRDPRLQEAVCGLASEILGNRMRMPGIAWYYTVGTAAGVFGIVLLAFTVSAGQHGGRDIPGILSAVLAVHQMVTYFVLLPRQRKKKVAKALRVNSGIEGQPGPWHA